MDKVLVEVFVPVLDCSFDMFLPLHLSICEVLTLLKKAISDLSDHCFVADDDTVLCRRDDGKILDINMSVYELNICNGSKLMLI